MCQFSIGRLAVVFLFSFFFFAGRGCARGAVSLAFWLSIAEFSVGLLFGDFHCGGLLGETSFLECLLSIGVYSYNPML